jgi:ABC-type amino acid transport substrate-binding protein
MVKVLQPVLVVFVLLFSPLLLAKQELRIGVGNFPPFFIEKDNKGIFLDITKEVFKQLPEYDVKYIYMSNHRLLHEINRGKIIDVACNIFPDSTVNAHLSESVFRFTDVAITKKNKQFEIDNIEDLHRYSIAAYQGAKDLLGQEYIEMTRKNSDYSEHAHPRETTYLMVSGQKDIRIGDINIFWHDLKNKHYQDEIMMHKNDFTVHRLWPDAYSHMAFKDAHLRDAVNKIIKQLKEDGSIDKIYAKYQM